MWKYLQLIKRQTKSVKAPDMAGHAKIYAWVCLKRLI